MIPDFDLRFSSKIVYDYLQKHSRLFLTPSELSNNLGVDLKVIENSLEYLVKNNMVVSKLCEFEKDK